MFYFRCGKETGRFKFSVKLTAPMGILTECSCFLFFTKDISILAPPKSKSRNSDVSIVCITPENRVQLPASR